MGCGCGKKAARPNSSPAITVSQPPSGASRTVAAKTYQSGTMKTAPKGPVGRKTV